MRYFQEFVSTLQHFEKKRGLGRRRPASREMAPFHQGGDGGIHVHLGPGLRAEIKFYVQQ